jgi:hypothetical protein
MQVSLSQFYPNGVENRYARTRLGVANPAVYAVGYAKTASDCRALELP